MQFLQISKNTTLSELSNSVGSRNVDSILHLNSLQRVPKIGQEFYAKCKDAVDNSRDVTVSRKAAMLNTFTEDSDIFETAALLGSSGWKVISSLNTLPSMLKIPDDIILPQSEQILGDKQHIESAIYDKVMEQLLTPPHVIDPSVFSKYSAIRPSRLLDTTSYTTQVFEWFNIPWGEVTLYSTLSNSAIDFPVFPEETSDGVHAIYTQMPDIIYQYEPWQLYQSSGPRTNTYSFSFHRDMWTGDHNDGKANELIRFCMANCYPNYRGALVNAGTVALYIHGDKLIEGILTDVVVNWDGPLGHDMWYLHCKLDLTITEVSSIPLSHDSMMRKSLIS